MVLVSHAQAQLLCGSNPPRDHGDARHVIIRTALTHLTPILMRVWEYKPLRNQGSRMLPKHSGNTLPASHGMLQEYRDANSHCAAAAHIAKLGLKERLRRVMGGKFDVQQGHWCE